MSSTTVVRFPGHRLHRGCSSEENCIVCIGGLGWCTVCGGAEASMPTDCPGEEMDELTALAVQQGLLDYKVREGWYPRDEWHEERPTCG